MSLSLAKSRKTPMTLHHSTRRCQLPDLFDWLAEPNRRIDSHAVRWVARRCRVSLATARTIADNADIGGERSR
jgi:hypothetical protein